MPKTTTRTVELHLPDKQTFLFTGHDLVDYLNILYAKGIERDETITKVDVTDSVSSFQVIVTITKAIEESNAQLLAL